MSILSKIFDSVTWGFAFSMSVLFVTLTVFTFGPRLESAFFPVIDQVSAAPVMVDMKNSVMMLTAAGTKQRQCEWQSISAMVERNGIWDQGKVFFEDPRVDPSASNDKVPPSRPTGAQSLGFVYVYPHGDKVKVYLHHRCHPLWQTKTYLYELDLHKAVAQTTK